MKIIADIGIPFLKDVLEPYASIQYLPAAYINADTVKDADALLIRTRTIINETLLKDSQVKFIGTATIGYDHIDTGYCEKRRIKWVNAPGCNASSVSQYVLAALLELSFEKKIDFSQHCMGIVGLGNVGSRIRQVAALLGLKVLVNDPPRERLEGPGEYTDLDTLLRNSDIISLHVPLNLSGPDQTYHLLNSGNFSKIRQGTVLINTSRGEVVDSIALKSAIRDGIVSDIVLDVWENEPDPNPELIDISFIATPHIAGYSVDGKAKGTSMAVNALAEFFQLPLSGWFPADLQPPLTDQILLSQGGSKKIDTLTDIVRKVYDIRSEDKRFRLNSSNFESLRNNYPVRREFTAYKIILQYNDPEMEMLLSALGFQIIHKQ